MFSEAHTPTSGKHMICDIRNIKNLELLNNPQKIGKILDTICETNNYTILNRVEHQFQPQGLTMLYLLSESHISIHTFPERDYFALDIYTCRAYGDNRVYEEIYEYLVKEFEAERGEPKIFDRAF
jgi:S-adenosylmethionine decarboxylase